MQRILKIRLLWSLPLLAILAAALYASRGDLAAWLQRRSSDESHWFTKIHFPHPTMTYLYDLGVVDANDDGWLDIYTSNHNYRQMLLLADGQGGWRDALSAWGLDQDSKLPVASLMIISKKSGLRYSLHGMFCAR